MRKSTILILALALASGALLTGCGRKEPAAKPKVVSARSLPPVEGGQAASPAPVQGLAPLPGPESKAERPPEPKPAGSDTEPQKPKSNVVQVLTAPGDYVYEAAVTVPRFAKDSAGTSQVKHDIELFKAEKGRLPETLKELEEYRGAPLPKLPVGHHYKYNPKTGEISIEK